VKPETLPRATQGSGSDPQWLGMTAHTPSDFRPRAKLVAIADIGLDHKQRAIWTHFVNTA